MQTRPAGMNLRRSQADGPLAHGGPNRRTRSLASFGTQRPAAHKPSTEAGSPATSCILTSRLTRCQPARYQHRFDTRSEDDEK